MIGDLSDMGILPLHGALAGKHKEPDASPWGDRQAVGKPPIGDGSLPVDLAEVSVGAGLAELELALRAEVVVRLTVPHHLEGEVRGRHETNESVGAEDFLLLPTQHPELATIIHSPDPLLAHLGEIPFQLGGGEIGA